MTASAAERVATASGLHAVPAIRDELVLVDRVTGVAHRLWVQDGVLVWDRGGQTPWIGLHFVAGQIHADPVEPA